MINFSKKMQSSIYITSSHNDGFIIECGCAKLVYTDVDELIKDLNDYLKNPEEVETAYNIALNKIGNRPATRIDADAGANIDAKISGPSISSSH